MGRDHSRIKIAHKRAFTLIELLTVLTIITVFMGVMFPLGEQFIAKSHRVADIQHLRQVALAYFDYLTTNSENQSQINAIKNAHDFAVLLAKNNYINNPECYLSKAEKTTKSIPSDIVVHREDDTWEISPKFPISWVIITGVPINKTQLPIAYSRGLDLETGTWIHESPYGIQGGLVAFFDGRVQFVPHVKGKWKDYKTGKSTNNLRKALPDNAHAYDANGRVW